MRCLAPILAGCLLWATHQANGTLSASESVAGTWKWTNEMADRTIHSTLELRSDGEQLSGSYQNENVKADVQHGTLNGKDIQFEVNFLRGERDIKAKFKGQVSAAAIEGSIQILVDGEQRGNTFDWLAKRSVQKQDVVGTWEFQFTSPDGVAHQQQLVIVEKGSKLTGTLVDGERVTEIPSVTLGDDHFQFEFTSQFEGSDVDVKYQCIPRGDRLSGTLHYELNGDSGEFEIAAERQRLPVGLLGEWKFSMTGPDGVARTMELKLSEASGKLVAQLSNEDQNFEPRDLTYEQGEVKFAFSSQHNGAEVALTWTSSLSGNDAMRGILTFDADGNVGEIPMTGERQR